MPQIKWFTPIIIVPSLCLTGTLVLELCKYEYQDTTRFSTAMDRLQFSSDNKYSAIDKQKAMLHILSISGELAPEQLWKNIHATGVKN